MEVRSAGPDDRAWIEEVLVGRWGSTDIASRRGTQAAATLPALLAENDGERVGLLTFHEADGQLEVVTLDALVDSVGVGTALLARAREIASEHGHSRVWLVTSNDNLRALRFYQRRGFRLVAVHVGGVDDARVYKPSIPTAGLDGIPVHDEIELECGLGP
jgi:ribosomal protein S18 acetylase RimI-like enzyme